MDQGQTEDNGKRVERRRGVERRARPLSSDPSRNRIQVLLARMISVFIGGLVGFLVAHVVSADFIEQWRTADEDARQIITKTNTELQELEPDYVDAKELWQKHYTEFEVVDPQTDDSAAELTGEIRTVVESVPDDIQQDSVETEAELDDAGQLEATADAEATPVPVEVEESSSITWDEFQEIRERYKQLQNQRQRLLDRKELWEADRQEYLRKIDLLNGLGIVIVVVFVFIGYLFYPLTLLIIKRMARQMELLSSGLEQKAGQATVGFFAGLVIAVVVLLAVFNMFGSDSTVLNYPWFRLVFGAFVVIVTGVSGSLIGVSYFGPPREDDPYREFRKEAAPKVLDTSVIIDGRVHEIANSGFLGGLLIVTNSVLRELQTMADSANERKRSKGRRGLELLRKMQDDPRVEVQVFDDSAFDLQAQSTDEQLILVAQAMNGWVVTNDYNLNRVAAIRNVRVININALANAVKTTHLPGDEIDIAILDRGKQRGQGVGYLEDGTMVVVEDGEPYIGKTKTLKLTSVSQTVQGRLLFGRVDLVQE